MRGQWYSEEQIVGILKEGASGMPLADLLRKHGIADATYYRWKAKYSGMELSDLKKMKGLEDENRRLKRLVADQALDIQMLKDINSRKW